MILSALFLACLQDTDVIPRNLREVYLVAMGEYEKAWANLDSDPKTAQTAIDRLFLMQRVDKKDRRIQLERLNGTLQKPTEFFPYYLRGRVRLAMAKNDPNNAQAYLSAAVADFKASVESGVKPSEDYLRSARAQLAALKAPKPPAPDTLPAKPSSTEEAFREGWFKLIEAHKFKAARDYIDHQGSSLAAARRQSYVHDTEEECRKSVEMQLTDFSKAMEVTARPGQLRATKPAEFARLFDLPLEADVIGTFPELDWARHEKPVLDAVRMSTARAKEEEYPAILDRLLAQFVAAEPLDRTGENRWFRISGMLVFRYLEEVLLSLGTQAKDAPPDVRGRLHEGAEKARARWSDTLAKFSKDFLSRNQVFENAKRLTTLLEEFPVDIEELKSLNLDSCLAEGGVPDAALEHLISDLSKIRDEHAARLPKDSARKLLTELVAATAAHDLLQGKSAEDVVKGLHELGRTLAQAGGAVEPEHYGPRIEKIFDALR